MSRHKLRLVVCLLVCSCIFSGCGGSKKDTSEEQEYNSLGMKQGDDGWWYKEGDETGYYDDYGNRYEIGQTDVAFDDMIFNYLKSVAMLDFSAAYNYLVSQESSTVINNYLQNSVDDSLAGNSVDTDTITFNRKIYKQFLLSIEVLGIEDTVYAGDSNIVTVNIRHKDFTNLDFWRKDYDTIMNTLLDINENSNSYDDIETQTTDYLVKYILNAFDNENAPTRESEIEIVLTKNNMGAWQISSDADLAKLAQDNNGSYIVENIDHEFTTYYADWKQEQYEQQQQQQQ